MPKNGFFLMKIINLRGDLTGIWAETVTLVKSISVTQILYTIAKFSNFSNFHPPR